MTPPLLQLEKLHFAYPGRGPVLQGASLSMKDGEKIGLIGDNGRGKSTLLLCTVGLLTPQSGRVLLRGNPVRTEKQFHALRREVGLLFQNADDQLFSPTVLEDVCFGPLNLGQTRKQAAAAAERALAAVGLEGFEGRLTHQLSGGEKRLAALAGVLAMRPKALLLDEPTNDLDRSARSRLLEVLRRLDLACLVISHDWDFLVEAAEFHYVLEEGVIEKDTPARLHRHAHRHPLGHAPHTHE